MDTVRDDAIMSHSMKSLQDKNSQRMTRYKKRRKDDMLEEDTETLKTFERERKRERRAKLKGRQLPNVDPLELSQSPRQTSADSKRKLRAKQKANDSDVYFQNERKRFKELRKKRKEEMTAEEKAELKEMERERKRRRRLKEEADLSSFPSWIEKEIDELEKELNVRPRKIKLWQMTEEQLEEKRKYEREKQRRQRAKIKAQKSIYDPLDLLQINSSNVDYDDDDEGCVQHLWRPDVE